MIAITNKSNGSSLKNTSEQEQHDAESQIGGYTVIIDVYMSDRSNAMFAKNGTTVNVCVFNMRDYHQADVLKNQLDGVPGNSATRCKLVAHILTVCLVSHV